MACVRAAFCPTGIIVRASGHQALYGVEYGELFLSLSAIQKANPFRDASTNDTRTALQRMDSTYVEFRHNQDVRCRKLEHVSFVAIQIACAHLFENHLTRIALTASAKALAPSSPILLL